jgi:hypothetical protein
MLRMGAKREIVSRSIEQRGEARQETARSSQKQTFFSPPGLPEAANYFAKCLAKRGHSVLGLLNCSANHMIRGRDDRIDYRRKCLAQPFHFIFQHIQAAFPLLSFDDYCNVFENFSPDRLAGNQSPQ